MSTDSNGVVGVVVGDVGVVDDDVGAVVVIIVVSNGVTVVLFLCRLSS